MDPLLDQQNGYFFEMNPWFSRNGGASEQFQGESSELLIQETIRFIDRAWKSQQPFFAVVWFGSPHEPYSGLPEDLALYDALRGRYSYRCVTLTGMDTGLPVRRSLGEVLQERYAEITAMDRALGILRKHLADEGLRDNTLLWYCGDNGVPASSGCLATPFRGLKGQIYDGGIRVPGIIEWPGQIREPGTSDVNNVTSDVLPTICELLNLPFPDRPLDGISLKPLIDGKMTTRPEPICFWNYAEGGVQIEDSRPYIEVELPQGTTPLVKIMDGKLTRDFHNFYHPKISAEDYAGPRAILDNRWKLVISGLSSDEPKRELFDLRADPAEANNLIEMEPETAWKLEQQLREWQKSVLTSLTGVDYAEPTVRTQGR